MPLSDLEADTLALLEKDAITSATADSTHASYYEGTQRLLHLGLAVPPALRRFETVVNWPRLAVDSLEERLDVEGFRFGGESRDDAELWDGWQASNMDEESSLAHLDALVYGRSFVAVGSSEAGGLPIISVESPLELTVKIDARLQLVSSALRLYRSADDVIDPDLATLYLPDVTVWLERDRDLWLEVDRDAHGLGRVPVVPMLNRRRTGSWRGSSEMADVIPLTDAAARALTNLQVAAETHMVPQRYVLGATKGDFVDAATGEPLPTWQAYFSSIWALANSSASVGQLSPSDLSNFHETVNHYASLVAALTGLPRQYLGFSTDQPASAEAIKSSESRLVKRAERKQRSFSGTWEPVMRLFLRLRDGEWDPAASRLETRWRNAGTPTYSAIADAVVKQYQAGLLPVEAAWEELGFTETRRSQLRAMRDRDNALTRDAQGGPAMGEGNVGTDAGTTTAA